MAERMISVRPAGNYAKEDKVSTERRKAVEVATHAR